MPFVMRKLLSFLAFTLLVSTLAFSQSNGGGNGNNQNNWPPTVGESSTACGVSNALIQGAQGAGSGSPALSWPMNKVVAILRVARPYFSNTNLGQMIQAYNACSCVITYLGEGYFRVSIGGLAGVVVIDEGI
jgi:hypothetical protein